MRYYRYRRYGRSCDSFKLIFIVIVAFFVCYLVGRRTRFHYYKQFYTPINGGLSTYSVVLTKGEEYKLYVYTVNKRIKYSSSDITVATVNFNGKITAWHPGTAVITVKYKDKKLKCRVKVIDLNRSVIRLKKGQSFDLDVKYVRSGVKWTSKNTKIANVARSGKVTARKRGKTYVVAEYQGKKMRCKIIVK